MNRFILPAAAFLFIFSTASNVVAQDRRDGSTMRSPRVSAGIARPARVSGEVRESRRLGYRARVYSGYDGYGYRARRYYPGYGYAYRPYRYYRSYGYGPVAYGYRRGDYCDW